MLPMEHPLSVVNTFHGKGHTRSKYEWSLPATPGPILLTGILLLVYDVCFDVPLSSWS